MVYYICTKLVVLLLAMLSFITEAQADPLIGIERTKWAVLIAGSNTYGNYRHQADVCHTYQVLKKGGFKDENIIVFMYDDIAYNVENPRPGVIINKPYGDDVYAGVPKDYTGVDVNVANFFAVILGNKTALTGGSGKVVDSSPNDHIFIYYADHGGPGTLGMPDYKDMLYAKDLIDVLKKKHASKSYRRMVIYVEACEAGSMFEGLLPENLNIYVTTASNATESSWATYCSAYYPDVAVEAGVVCLGDTYSIAWIEDSEIHDLRKESLEEQYQAVRRRTAYEGLLYDSDIHSNVMQYGTKEISTDFLDSYIGSNPANKDNSNLYPHHFTTSSSSIPKQMVNQRDADIFQLSHKIQQAPEGSKKRVEAQKQLNAAISKRLNEDKNMKSIAMRLFGSKNSLAELQTSARPQGQPLVDDWDCFKSLVRIYEEKCGTLSRYGRKYTRAIANMCNAKINAEQMAMASEQVCGKST